MSLRQEPIIRVCVIKNPCNAIYPPADFSIVNLGDTSDESRMLFTSLYNTSADRHLVLALARGKKKHRLDIISTITESKKNWNYLDTVHISYEGHGSRGNSGLLPYAEIGFLLYKGQPPDVSNTSWFSLGDSSNSTNLWALVPFNNEGTNYIGFQEFSWELIALLMSLSEPMATRKFIYTLPVDEETCKSMYRACVAFNLTAYVTVSSDKEAEKINNIIKELEQDEKRIHGRKGSPRATY